VGFWAQLTQAQAVLVAGAIGAVGAITGALVANVVGQLLSVRGLGRRHWEQVRHLTYAEVMEAFHAVWDMYGQDGVLVVPRPEEDRRASKLMTAYSRAALLVRTTETARALDALNACAQYLWSRQGRTWSDVDRACYEIEARFRQSARKELGIPSVATMTYAQHRRLYELDPPPGSPTVAGASGG
jgi:hypothetical protein